MDLILEDSREDKLIEDYLFSGYRPAGCKSTFDKDQQFAKPIEDEDLFGCIGTGNDLGNEQPEQVEDEENNDVELSLSDDIARTGPVDNLDDILPYNNIFDDPEEASQPADVHDEPKAASTEDNVNDLDKSMSNERQPSPDENICPPKDGEARERDEEYRHPIAMTYARSQAREKAQSRKELKEKLLEQARAMGIKPRRLGTGFGPEDKIEVTIEQDRLVSDSKSKFLFNKLFNKSKKAVDSSGTPERKTMNWEHYKANLRKRICTEKRKVWDSFQQPTDGYNDEEELIEEAGEGDAEEQQETADDDVQSKSSGDKEQNNSDDENNEDGENEESEAEDAEQDNDGTSGGEDDEDDDEAVVRKKDRTVVEEEYGDGESHGADEEEEVIAEPIKKVNKSKNRRRCRMLSDDEDDDEEVNLYSDDEQEIPAKKRRRHESDDEPVEESVEDILFG